MLRGNQSTFAFGYYFFIFLIYKQDTAGQEKYNALAPVYYKNADAAILVYDITIKETLQKVQKWVEEIKQFSHS